jgi:peptidoglycan/LPS O-acetylase OafA/YrhL
MAYTTCNRHVSPSAFLGKRLARVFPLYALALLLVCAFVLAGFRLFGVERIELTRLVLSLLFIPAFDAGGHAVHPYLFVGWTLQYEMFFYIVFSIALFSGHRHRELVVIAFFMTIAAAAELVASPLVRYYANPIVWEFVYGILIAKYALSSVEANASGKALFAQFLIGIGILLLALGALAYPDLTLAHRSVFYGIPAAMIVLGSVLLEKCGSVSLNRLLLTLGFASYSIYLTHPFVLQFAGKAVIMAGITQSLPLLLGSYILMAIGVGIVGVLCYTLVERPVASGLSRRARHGNEVLSTA